MSPAASPAFSYSHFSKTIHLEVIHLHVIFTSLQLALHVFCLFGDLVTVLNSLPLTLSGSHYGVQADLSRLTIFLPAFQMLGLQAWTTIPSGEGTACGL